MGRDLGPKKTSMTSRQFNIQPIVAAGELGANWHSGGTGSVVPGHLKDYLLQHLHLLSDLYPGCRLSRCQATNVMQKCVVKLTMPVEQLL